jgi:hypothetical protein
MFDAMNMGALDSEFFYELFADKFGLVKDESEGDVRDT